MGLIESLTGWRREPDYLINRGIISKAKKELAKKSKVIVRQGKGEVRDIPRTTIYIESGKFRYKIVKPTQHYREEMGKGVYFGGAEKYYKKPNEANKEKPAVQWKIGSGTENSFKKNPPKNEGD